MQERWAVLLREEPSSKDYRRSGLVVCRACSNLMEVKH